MRLHLEKSQLSERDSLLQQAHSTNTVHTIHARYFDEGPQVSSRRGKRESADVMVGDSDRSVQRVSQAKQARLGILKGVAQTIVF